MRRRDRTKSAVALVWLAVWIGAALFADIRIGGTIVRQARASARPAVEGVVVAGDVERVRPRGRGSGGYWPRISVQYEVDGQRFVTHRWRYLVTPFATSREAEAIVRSIPPGASRQVWFDPGHPADAVLCPGLDGADIARAMFLVPFNAIAVISGLLVGHPMLRSLRNRWVGRPCQARPKGVPPSLIPFVLSVGGLAVYCFVASLGVQVALGNHPPKSVAIWVLAAGLTGAAALYVWEVRRVRAGHRDIRFG